METTFSTVESFTFKNGFKFGAGFAVAAMIVIGLDHSLARELKPLVDKLQQNRLNSEK
jgi:ribosomal protein L13E